MSALVITTLAYVERNASGHGQVRYFFRKDGVRLCRLPDDPESEQFMTAYWAARNGNPILPATSPPAPHHVTPVKAGTLRWLFANYLGSDAYLVVWPKRLNPFSARSFSSVLATKTTSNLLNSSGSYDSNICHKYEPLADANVGTEPLALDKSTRAKRRAIIDAMMQEPITPGDKRTFAGMPADQMHYMVTEHGSPYIIKGLGQRISQWFNQAGLPHCTARSVRKAVATNLA